MPPRLRPTAVRPTSPREARPVEPREQLPEPSPLLEALRAYLERLS